MELAKTMQIGFSNVFLQYFQKLFLYYGRGPIFPMLVCVCAFFCARFGSRSPNLRKILSLPDILLHSSKDRFPCKLIQIMQTDVRPCESTGLGVQHTSWKVS